MRSRLTNVEVQRPRLRITSACAEQTAVWPRMGRGSGDHLRVCGADFLVLVLVKGNAGSPPRVRSRRRALSDKCVVSGITSACAEQTA